MNTSRKYKERRFELAGIYQGIRSIAKELSMPIWGASQAIAKGFSKSIITAEDLEESKIGKGGTVSLMLSINQTPEEKEDGVARIFVALSSREVIGKDLRTVEADFRTMYMSEMGPPKSKQEKEEQKEEKLPKKSGGKGEDED
jgi:hypothetical protein